jgi:hypothetical protein
MEKNISELQDRLKNEMFIDIITIGKDDVRKFISGETETFKFTTSWNTSILAILTPDELKEIEDINQRKLDIIGKAIVKDIADNIDKDESGKDE